MRCHMESIHAVFGYREDSGTEQTIVFASRSLLPAEHNSQLNKEVLALVLGVTKFPQYL